jgi:ankyrin repeat protein
MPTHTQLADGADVDCRDDRGRTPLHAACSAVSHAEAAQEVIRQLLERGARAGLADDHGVTPAHLAAKHGW